MAEKSPLCSDAANWAFNPFKIAAEGIQNWELQKENALIQQDQFQSQQKTEEELSRNWKPSVSYRHRCGQNISAQVLDETTGLSKAWNNVKQNLSPVLDDSSSSDLINSAFISDKDFLAEAAASSTFSPQRQEGILFMFNNNQPNFLADCVAKSTPNKAAFSGAPLPSNEKTFHSKDPSFISNSTTLPKPPLVWSMNTGRDSFNGHKMFHDSKSEEMRDYAKQRSFQADGSHSFPIHSQHPFPDGSQHPPTDGARSFQMRYDPLPGNGKSFQTDDARRIRDLSHSQYLPNLMKEIARMNLSENYTQNLSTLKANISAGQMNPQSRPMNSPVLGCVFCKNNKYPSTFYSSHLLKDKLGRPVLRQYTCPLCNAVGDNAHTIKFCPLNTVTNGDPIKSGLPPGMVPDWRIMNAKLQEQRLYRSWSANARRRLDDDWTWI